MVEHSSTAPAADLDAVFGALADPTRRALVTALAEGEASLSALARPFPMSLPAVAKHVAVLERAGLVEHARVGREKRCRLAAAPLATADAWLSRYQSFWQSRLAALDHYLTGGDAGDT